MKRFIRVNVPQVQGLVLGLGLLLLGGCITCTSCAQPCGSTMTPGGDPVDCSTIAVDLAVATPPTPTGCTSGKKCSSNPSCIGGGKRGTCKTIGPDGNGYCYCGCQTP